MLSTENERIEDYVEIRNQHNRLPHLLLTGLIHMKKTVGMILLLPYYTLFSVVTSFQSYSNNHNFEFRFFVQKLLQKYCENLRNEGMRKVAGCRGNSRNQR